MKWFSYETKQDSDEIFSFFSSKIYDFSFRLSMPCTSYEWRSEALNLPLARSYVFLIRINSEQVHCSSSFPVNTNTNFRQCAWRMRVKYIFYPLTFFLDLSRRILLCFILLWAFLVFSCKKQDDDIIQKVIKDVI